MTFFGLSVADALAAILRAEKPIRILLVTGKQSFDQLNAREYFDRLASKCDLTRYCDFSPNPKYDDLVRAVTEMRGPLPELIVAVGGGSTIDFAKLLALGLAKEEIRESKPTDLARSRAVAPIVAIPTTAGSGSEATHFAVLYHSGVKQSIASEQIRPAYAVVDPECTETMDARLTAVSGVDAISQSIESLWARGATAESRLYAEMALRLMIPSFRRAVSAPSADCRRDMAYGSHYAGKAIDISKTTGPHAMSYHLTSQYGIPHGEAVGIFLPVFMRLNAEHIDTTVADIVCEVLDVDTWSAAITRIRELLRSAGLRTSIRQVGVEAREQVDNLVGSVNKERLANNPAPVSGSEIRSALMDQDVNDD
jgi:alcohol dehydrogenase class IV